MVELLNQPPGTATTLARRADGLVVLRLVGQAVGKATAVGQANPKRLCDDDTAEHRPALLAPGDGLTGFAKVQRLGFGCRQRAALGRGQSLAEIIVGLKGQSFTGRCQAQCAAAAIGALAERLGTGGQQGGRKASETIGDAQL